MKDIESQAIEYAEALNDIADVLDMPTGATAAEIVERARNRWANGLHTCGERCTRERCVERRKLKAMREALRVADECLALIEDVGHGAMTDNVSVARGIVLRALDSEQPKYAVRRIGIIEQFGQPTTNAMNPCFKDLHNFADLLQACNIVDEEAVYDPDGYDGEVTTPNP